MWLVMHLFRKWLENWALLLIVSLGTHVDRKAPGPIPLSSADFLKCYVSHECSWKWKYWLHNILKRRVVYKYLRSIAFLSCLSWTTTVCLSTLNIDSSLVSAPLPNPICSTPETFLLSPLSNHSQNKAARASVTYSYESPSNSFQCLPILPWTVMCHLLEKEH